MKLIKSHVYLLFIPIFVFSLTLCAEKVYKFRYNDSPEPLNGTTVSVQSLSVALDKYIFVGDSTGDGNAVGVVSVMLVVDNTNSIMQAWTDYAGKRWEVCNTLAELINKKSPSSEIGFAVFGRDLFFKASDENLFIVPPGSTGAYLQLLKLNDTYSSTAFGSGSGYTILKNFLKYTPNYPHLPWIVSHPVDAEMGKATNIDMAMKTGKNALLNARYPKANRFIILITDGFQEGAGTNEYLLGKETPTTFTFFIGSLPETITQMTNAIKTNGYSTSNPKSAAWSLTASDLGNLAVNTIIPTIFQQLRFVPSQLTVNGISSSSWDKKGFTFPELFPLLDWTTPFAYSINYKIYKDSGSTSTFVKDTLVKVNYTAKVDPGPSTPKVDHFWWERTFRFFKNGVEINAITESSGDVECRFYMDEGTAKYQYTKVDIEASNVATTPRDKVNLSTTKQGTYFTTTITHAAVAIQTGDNVLQHTGADSLVATYRNPLLPLDTLRAAIPFQSGDMVYLSRASYCDINADGMVDSIAVEFSGNSIKPYSAEILKKLQLPAWRSFTIGPATPYDNTIGLRVTQGLAQPVTAVTKDDTVKITDTVNLTGDFKLAPGAVWVVDKVAPVVVKASMIDSLKAGARDELTVTLSETVQNVTSNKPFYFYVKATNTRYTATLTQLSKTGADVLFSVDALQGAAQITDGDSIHVKYDETAAVTVVDMVDNRQSNPQNIKRPVTVTVIPDEINLQIRSATYFDLTGDGKVDSIAILISGKDVQKYATAAAAFITLPAFRVLNASTTVAHANGLALTLSEAGPLTTFITDKDSLIIDAEHDLGDNVTLLKSRIAFTDAIAPILMSASLHRYTAAGRADTLTTLFSEPVEAIATEKPFALFSKPNGFKQYNTSMKAVSQNGPSAMFEITEIPYITVPVQGDSICISWTLGTNVVDKAGNNQAHPKNTRRELAVYLVKGIALKKAVYFDTDARGDIERILLSFSETVTDAYKDAIAQQLHLPGYRMLQKGTATVVASQLVLDVTEQSGLCKTDVSAQDIVSIGKQIQLDSATILDTGTITCEDSMAPVLVSAVLADSLQETSADYLTITFSEPVPVPLPTTEPFWFYHANQLSPSYSFVLESPVAANATVSYIISNKQVCDQVLNDDSVRIAVPELSEPGISDAQSNVQKNPKNILRHLKVKRISAPFTLEFSATILDRSMPISIDAELAGVPEIQQMLGPINSAEASVMVMVVEPKPRNNLNTTYQAIKASLALYDPVGNCVQDNMKMYFDKKNKRCIYFWDGANLQNRQVGSGGYCALVSARVVEVAGRNRGTIGEEKVIKGFVGVK